MDLDAGLSSNPIPKWPRLQTSAKTEYRVQEEGWWMRQQNQIVARCSAQTAQLRSSQVSYVPKLPLHIEPCDCSVEDESKWAETGSRD